MRLGGNTLRGSNPRSSAVTSSFARALRPGGLLVSALRGPCVATAAIGRPVTSPLPAAARALPCPESGPARPHHHSAGRDVCRWFASRARHPVRSAKAERQGRRDKGSAPAADPGLQVRWQLPDVLAEHRARAAPLATGTDRNAANWCFRAIPGSKLPGSKPGSSALSWCTRPYRRSVVPILIRPPLAAAGSHAA